MRILTMTNNSNEKEYGMRKIDYSKIKWNAATNWEFCGSAKNLEEVCERHCRFIGGTSTVVDIAYNRPIKSLAYDKGDVVTCTLSNGTVSFAVVRNPLTDTGYLEIMLADGTTMLITQDDLTKMVKIADIPYELVALARAEAGRPLDLSKCPLKDAGVCMKGGEA